MVRWGENKLSHSTSLVFSFSNRDCTAYGTLIFKSSLHLKSEDTLISLVEAKDTLRQMKINLGYWMKI